jgi:hypothetical protein
MTSLQMRPGDARLWNYFNTTGPDLLGGNWTLAGHLAAWGRLARNYSSYPEIGKRVWAFDFTNMPPNPYNASQVSLDTAHQVRVFEALEAAHPCGHEAVIAKTEVRRAKQR